MAMSLEKLEWQKINQIVIGEAMGDSSPGEFYRRLQSLASNDHLRWLADAAWKAGLPAYLKIYLSHGYIEGMSAPMGMLVRRADSKHYSDPSRGCQTKTVEAASTFKQDTTSRSVLDILNSLETSVSDLSQRMGALEKKTQSSRRGRSHSRAGSVFALSRRMEKLEVQTKASRGRSHSRADNARHNRSKSRSQLNDKGWCLNHEKFGHETYNCCNPQNCLFKSSRRRQNKQCS